MEFSMGLFLFIQLPYYPTWSG